MGLVVTTNLNYKIAEAYRLSNRWVEAIPYYEKAFEAKLLMPEAHFHYSFALKAAEKYDMALRELQQFIDSKSTIKAYNEKSDPGFPVHAFIMPVEQSSH